MESKPKKQKTTYELIAAIFFVSPSYVKSILKIGDTNAEYFERIRLGRMAVYSAYSACIQETKKYAPDVPKEKEAVMFDSESFNKSTPQTDSSEVVKSSSTQKLVLKEGEAIPETIEYQSKDGEIHSINLKQFIYHEK